MIRSTDIQGAMRSRQRGFLLNPYRFGSSPAIPSDVVLYVRGDGADGSTTIIDSSLHARTLTAGGSTAISTTQSQFGGSSVKFPGVAGGRFSAAASTNFDFGSGDLTIAAWVWIAGTSPADADGARGGAIVNCWQAPFVVGYSLHIIGDSSTTGTGLSFDTWNPSSPGNGTLFSASASISQNAWHHVQVCVSGGTRYLFLDGTLLSGSSITIGSGYTQANSAGSDVYFGSGVNSSYPLPLNAYVDELIMIKGHALNTASFTPPTAPYF